MRLLFQSLCLISIHALREEGDHRMISTAQTNMMISIHALREEGDKELSKT